MPEPQLDPQDPGNQEESITRTETSTGPIINVPSSEEPYVEEPFKHRFVPIWQRPEITEQMNAVTDKYMSGTEALMREYGNCFDRVTIDSVNWYLEKDECNEDLPLDSTKTRFFATQRNLPMSDNGIAAQFPSIGGSLYLLESKSDWFSVWDLRLTKNKDTKVFQLLDDINNEIGRQKNKLGTEEGNSMDNKVILSNGAAIVITPISYDIPSSASHGSGAYIRMLLDTRHPDSRKK